MSKKTIENPFSEYLFDSVSEHDMAELDPCERGQIAATHQKLAMGRKRWKAQILFGQTSCRDAEEARTTIDIIYEDIPFLVDSVVAEINRHTLLIDVLIHPYLYVSYTKDDKVEECRLSGSAEDIRQAHMHIRLNRLIPSSMVKKLKQGLEEVIRDVRLATGSWHKIRAQVQHCRTSLLAAVDGEDLSAETAEEFADFLEYLYDHNFTLLGYRHYDLDDKDKTLLADKASGMGLLDKSRKSDFLEIYQNDLPDMLQKLLHRSQPLFVFKLNRDSTVHRRVSLDAVAVRAYDSDGNVCGMHLLIGLFTSVTYSRSVADIPYLRMKVDDVIHHAEFIENSHDDKALRHILEKYPRDELLQIDAERLYRTTMEILSLQERQRIALFMRPDLFGRSLACLVYIPRDRYDTRMRKRFETILEQEVEGKCTSFYTTLDDSVFARVLFFIESNKKTLKKVDEKALEKRLQEAGKAWDEMLSDAFNGRYGIEAESYIEAWCGAFPVAYRERYTIAETISDIEQMEHLLDDAPISLNLYRPEHYHVNQMRLKIYLKDQPLILSDVLPILENMGLRVIAELPFEINPQTVSEQNAAAKGQTGEKIWIHDFLIETEHPGLRVEIDDTKDLFEEAFRKVWLKDMENDPLNRLVLGAVMNWREVVILRTYVHYLKQLDYPYSRSYIAQALTQFPEISRNLADCFLSRLNPMGGRQKGTLARACRLSIEEGLENVESLDQDRILRSMLGLIEATLRTNYFQTDDETGGPKSWLSIKIDSKAAPDMPEPKPYREIFVYSPRVEGIHLRGGPIARGGLRWSDRLEDYRTEVLGLMKAQLVKNAVIVPTGAKGGFVLKTPPKNGDRAALLEEGIACYKIFIRGLLDITDNFKAKKVIPPADTVRLDADDPYLVVAADKGTATFSDIANELSQEYGFWLGDAFASGGSAGYDHKKMGITARGAWESVRRHFRELNHDTQSQDFDVIGIGDMGGDVFGNGMLLSKHIRLIGAFNHLHIFCDPDPDIAASWKERKRLFDAVKGWGEYDEKLLSKGGRIFSRSEKRLTLTPEIQKRFGLEQSKVSPLEFMNAMLRTRTDLLWFGGIGTYIKSSEESHMEVGDKANDSIRINAAECGAKVIGEGANLAITQMGRVEFALGGGRINSDFIDNSGGVDSSDHEVNIKILLQAVMQQKSSALTISKRNKLLETMTENIANHVLYNNRQQAQAISLMERSAQHSLPLKAAFIHDLEKNYGFKRELEGLPDEKEIEARARAGKGLTRPELSVVQAYAKILLTDDILESSIPEQPQAKYWLEEYFPEVLNKKYPKHIAQHGLAREIIAMRLAGTITNRFGATFVKTCMQKTGAVPADVIRAYLIVRDVFQLPDLWNKIEAAPDSVPEDVRLGALKEAGNVGKALMSWMIERGLAQSEKVDQVIEAYAPRVAALRREIPKLLPEAQKNDIAGIHAKYVSDGLPKELAATLAHLRMIGATADIVRVALNRKDKNDLSLIGRVYFTLGEDLHFNWLRRQAEYLSTDDRWLREARDSLMHRLYELQVGVTQQVLQYSGKKVKDPYANWLSAHEKETAALHELINEFRRQGTPDFAMLTLAAERLQRMC